MKQGDSRADVRLLSCLTILALSIGIVRAEAGDVPKVADYPLPAHAVGFPSRDPQLDALPGFRNPPYGYGVVPFYWWLGDPLTKERLAWQLDKLAESGGVVGLQVNYAHSDKGGAIYGLTYPSDPPLFSQAWWDLFVWWAGECNKRGIAVSLSDYTLGVPGQGWWLDEILAEDSSLHGAVLESMVRPVEGDRDVVIEVPENTLSLMAYRLKGDVIEAGSSVDLRASLSGRSLRWKAPPGNWKVVVVSYRVVLRSVDPLNRKLGPQVVEHFFKRFEDHLPGHAGKGLNFFFSDELTFGVKGNLWTGSFPEEFKKRKGYDLLPVLPALYVDIGPSTPKIRLDYADVMVSLSEEGYFEPIFRWHADRGMLYGCDHGGRGTDVVEFGDYFRTQRWVTGPGNDAPGLSTDIIKDKVASSIGHMYQRPRVWLEGFYGSGWGTSTADLTRATLENFAMGHNLLSLHGLYYSTYGGWWEWAPPCNGFRMPYWPHMGEFMRFVQRLSYLLSQGVHRCDVAVIYPVAPMEAGMDGPEAVAAAFGIGRQMFDRGLDFDFMDDDSLSRAEIRDRSLQVAGEQYRVLVLPRLSAVRAATIEQALRFHRAGGIVIALGGLPEASDRAGRDDPTLDAMVREIFGLTEKERRAGSQPQVKRNEAGGVGMVFADADGAKNGEKVVPIEAVVNLINASVERDFIPAKPCHVLHRKVGQRDVFLVTRAGGSECFFRVSGSVELWDPWSGSAQPVRPTQVTPTGTKVRIPSDGALAHLIVFTPGDPGPLADNADGAATATSEEIAIDGPWEFELKPTLDNRWGDFRQPPSDGLIGAEARQLTCTEESPPKPGEKRAAVGVSGWRQTTCGFGPRFWKLGPVPGGADVDGLEASLKGLTRLDPGVPVTVGGREFHWQPYAYSLRFGIEGDPGHEGYHGLKEQVSDDFIALGVRRNTMTDSVYDKEADGGRYYLWTTVRTPGDLQATALVGGLAPGGAWLDGKKIDDPSGTLALHAGATPLLLRYDTAGRGHFVLRQASSPERTGKCPLAMSWYHLPGVLTFDPNPSEGEPVGWYRFKSPPGFRAMTLCVRGRLKAWDNGKTMRAENMKQRADGAWEYRFAVVQPVSDAVFVDMRVEQERGYYEGAALPEPIALECGPGQIVLGDWSAMGALSSYSGGAWYRKTVALSAGQLGGQLMLDLGAVVATAEVRVNGSPAGTRVAPPWQFDISGLVKPGENRIEVLVYNTLANHYSTIPTRYRGSMTAGLIGPVRIRPADGRSKAQTAPQ